ncbi:type B DNA-directed DNA polymerase [Methanoregula sp.]|jgi:DNA polymerase I|uniref:type B DNA-directed DNA polymerase n=1 Tax=Methanoregula sp. TaxID=2052170 RepID=UPI003C21ACA9
MAMWILDSAFRSGVDLWCKEAGGKGTVTRVHHDYDPPFFLHLPDPDRHHELVAALEEQYRAEACTVRTIFGPLEGWAVYADRATAEAIERQVNFGAQFYNVDVRRDQRFLAEHGLVPCGENLASRFSPSIPHNLTVMEIRIRDNPARASSCTDAEVINERTGRTERLQGEGRTVLADLLTLTETCDPDVILMSHADLWMQKLVAGAERLGIAPPFTRTGKYRTMGSRSYWSYGRMEYKAAALIPDGRVLIDTDQSFVYREGGLEGVLMAARLSGLSPNLAARFTPGTLISSYETYEAVRRGIAVPFRKNDVESARKCTALQAADRGGMMFQPLPGIYPDVDEIDFTSMYPTIIVLENLSPETISDRQRPGFLPAVLEPLVELRRATKRLKKNGPQYEGIDSILKWMLVTCFGYTGYRNAKFGQIEVHEAITGRSREILMQTKEIAEAMGFTVLHGIVDCLWVQGPGIGALRERVDRETGLFTEVEHFDWLVFLPLNDGNGAYNRYYGRLSDGSVKVRGIAARRHDTPEYIRTLQRRMLDAMAGARTIAELRQCHDEVRRLCRDAVKQLPAADPQELLISRRISRLSYAHRCIEGAAVEAYHRCGVPVEPGMKIRYVVRDARRYVVDTEWEAGTFDVPFYRGLLEKAWGEVEYAFTCGQAPAGVRWESRGDEAELRTGKISGQ